MSKDENKYRKMAMAADELSDYAQEEVAAARQAAGRGPLGMLKKDARRARRAAREHKQEVRSRARRIRSASKTRTAAGRFFYKYLHNFLGVTFMTAFLIVLVSETLARQTVYGGVLFLLQHPLVFLINVLIVFATITLAMFFRRKLFMFIVLSAAWLGFGIVNGIILSQRMTPLTTHDVIELKDGLSIATNYFSTHQLVMLAAGAALLVIVLIVLFIRLPKARERIHYRRALATYALIFAIAFGSVVGGMRTGILDTFFPNLAYGYRDNGFNYCFLATWLDQGIRKPHHYTAHSVNGIFTIEERNTTVPGRLPEMAPDGTVVTEETAAGNSQDGNIRHPNIIVVQLESFMDPTIIKGLECSEDPIPNFRRLSKTYSSGRLQVPAMGAGTANTELELMTGLSVKFFGPGEYPHKTILREETCESIPYDLKLYGYTNHAIHNHRGAFYSRNKVYPNLGFDTFTSLEYMNGITRTPKNWAKDDILPGEIFTALESTEGQDYVFCISVQGHGKYPTVRMLSDPVIRVRGLDNEELRLQWEYYVNQVYEMDQFVGDLTDQLRDYDEDTIVIFYGDHMPALTNISEETLTDGRNIYQTDYVIWSNFDLPEEDMDLYAYQAGAVMLDRIGLHNGTLVTFHQNHMGDDNYRNELKTLQYDMLYGKRYIYDGESPFLPTNLKMGVKDIKILSIEKIGDKHYIKGENFTEYSKVNLDGEILDTVYVSPSLLELREDVDASAVARMKISQVEKNKEILSTTE
ncbi:MAG: sulfatase-like hydrolase/transferase [Clostridiales bacterium]|nr:sulfatase-like hydrolase/transferase [Clostridiales bacterium]